MKIGFIGTGKIASAITEGLCLSNAEDLCIYLSPRNSEVGRRLEQKYDNVFRSISNQGVIDASDIVFLALRPDHFEAEARQLNFTEGQHVVSLIPTTSVQMLKKSLFPVTEISRAIPLPTVINRNCPIPVYHANDLVLNLFKKLGQPLEVDDEEQLNALWALTGLITPFYDLMDELTQWTVANGVDRQTASQYTADMFQSLSFAAQHSSPIDFKELSRHAATPKGLNEQAGKEIKENGSHEAYKSAASNLLSRINKKT